MVETKDWGLTPKEQAFCLYYFENRNPSLSSIQAGYPEANAKQHANMVLRRVRVKAYLRHLWEEAESPIVMSVRERKEKLSLIARGIVGDTITDKGDIDWDAVKRMPAVKEITIDETVLNNGGMDRTIMDRTIKVKLLNPVESIHELNLMEKLYRTNEGSVNINPTYNYYVTGKEVIEKLDRIGDRTQKQIALTGNGEEKNHETEE